MPAHFELYIWSSSKTRSARSIDAIICYPTVAAAAYNVVDDDDGYNVKKTHAPCKETKRNQKSKRGTTG